MYLETKERKWILVVDDDPEIRVALKELIEMTFGEKVCVVQACDGMEATTKINYQKFHCIVTDLMMPKKEGEPLIHSIRQNNLNEMTPIVVVSGTPNADRVSKEFQFIDVIQKPFQMQHLADVIKVNLKMGGNKNRVSADVLNNLVDATCNFIKGLTQEEISQVGNIEVKNKGDDVSEDLVSTIQVKIGKVVNTFSIMVEKEEFERLMEKQGNQVQKSAEEIMNSMSFVIMKHVLSKVGIIKKEQFQAASIRHDKKILRDKAGLLIKLGNDNFKVNVFATTK